MILKNGNKVKVGNKIYSVDMADTFVKRFFGLMGKKSIPADKTLFITPCNSIHTFFMRFSMIAVFVDENMIVKKVVKDMRPWDLAFAFSAKDVFEFINEGNEDLEISVGEKVIIVE